MSEKSPPLSRNSEQDDKLALPEELGNLVVDDGRPCEPRLPEGTYTFRISVTTGPRGLDKYFPTFIGLTVTVAEGPYEGRTLELKVFRDVTNWGKVQKLIAARHLARVLEGPDAPIRIELQECAEVIEQARRERRTFRAIVEWVGLDQALYEDLRKTPRSNAKGKATICGAKHFDHHDEHGLPVAIGFDGEFVRPEARITGFPKAQQQVAKREGHS